MTGNRGNEAGPSDELRLDGRAGTGDEWSLFAVGDCYLTEDARDPGDSIVSVPLQRRVSNADVTVANLEAPLRTETAEPIPKSGPSIANAPSAPAQVRRAGFDVVTLANNHVMDYGPEGLRATDQECADAGLETVGAGEDRKAAFEPQRVTAGGLDVALVSVCEREFGVAEAAAPGTAWSGHHTAFETVREASEHADVVVLFAHGGVEYVPVPPSQRRDRLRQFVDEGADVVLAHHPHVPQGWERYGEGVIFHSLGNFLFDSHTDAAATSWGLAVEVNFAGATPIGVDLVPTDVVDGAVEEMGETRSRSAHLAYLHRLSGITGERLEPYWQEIAVRKFHETYSTWLLKGIGDDRSRANANPYDAEAHRPLWDPDRRREELLTLLNVMRYESHRYVMMTALATLAGETEDRRSPPIADEVDELLDWTRP